MPTRSGWHPVTVHTVGRAEGGQGGAANREVPTRIFSRMSPNLLVL
ncbi:MULTISPECIES: hypothetical protein [unclassified Streptomyces]